MKNKVLLLAGLALLQVLFIQCSKDDNTNGIDEQGTLTVKVTDAPSDDTNIKGTFVTVADVKIDGKSVKGFTKQTIEISAYHSGNAKLIFSDKITAKNYNSVTLVFDFEKDVMGKSPGCYVLTDDNKKHNLAANATLSSSVNLSKSFSVNNEMETSLVIDIDLRRAIVRESGSAESNYRFVTAAELQSSIRVVDAETTGEIYGNVSSTLNPGDEIYVFAYKKGDFNLVSEIQGQGSSSVFFSKAITSAKVKNDGSYHLAFLEQGDYEMHVASFITVSETKTTFLGMLNASSTISGLLLSSISLSSKTELEVNINASGMK